MVLTKEQKAKAILTQSVAFLIDADVVYDTKTKTNEEIFGGNSIRNQPDKLTGSQLGVALGISTYSTPYKLWRQKRGIEEVIANEEKEIFKAGHAAEDFVAHMFARKLKEEYGENLESVDIINDTNMYQSRKFKWAIGQPDRFAIITFKSGKIVLVGLECKTAYFASINNWKDNSFPCPTFYEASGELPIPATYDCQSRDYMMTTSLDAWYVCCCWGFKIDQCSISLVTYDAQKEALIDEYATAFIECCVKGYEPVVCEENQQAMAEYLSNKYDLSKVDTVEMDVSYKDLVVEAVELIDEAAELKKKVTDNEKAQQKLAQKLVEKSDGKGTFFSYKDENKTFGISLSIPKFANSIDIAKIKENCPGILSKLAEIGLKKITKTDLEKIEIDGKKFDATPYVIEGAVNSTKPIKIGKVTVKELLAS